MQLIVLFINKYNGLLSLIFSEKDLDLDLYVELCITITITSACKRIFEPKNQNKIWKLSEHAYKKVYLFIKRTKTTS